MHRRGIDADKHAGGTNQCAEFGKREFARQIDHRGSRSRADRLRQYALGRIGCGRQHDAPPLCGKKIDYGGIGCCGPALELPSRPRMHDHEPSARKLVPRHKRRNARIRRGARNQHERLVRFFGPYSDTAQRIEILFDDVALGVAW